MGLSICCPHADLLTSQEKQLLSGFNGSEWRSLPSEEHERTSGWINGFDPGYRGALMSLLMKGYVVRVPLPLPREEWVYRMTTLGEIALNKCDWVYSMEHLTDHDRDLHVEALHRAKLECLLAGIELTEPGSSKVDRLR